MGKEHTWHVSERDGLLLNVEAAAAEVFSPATPPICQSQRRQAACGTKGRPGEETLYYGQMMESAFCLQRQST